MPTDASDAAAGPDELIQFRNCRLLRDHRLHRSLDLWVRNGRVIDPESVFFDERRPADRVVDCAGAICAAGFIDLQINGGYGIDFSNTPDGVSVADGVRLVARELLAHGVTAFCPTLVTSPPETYHRVLPQIRRQAGGRRHGATVLGTHLEGPFINVEKKGAHPAPYIRDFRATGSAAAENGSDDDAWRALVETYGEQGLQDVSIVTLAAEKPGARQAIAELTRRGVAVAQGHSMADLSEGEAGVRSGAGLITHLFNAMLPFHHRDPGLVGLLTSDALPAGRTVYYGLIADGCHTHPAALRIAYRSHPAGLCLVTDAIAGLGLADGIHMLGQLAIEVRESKAFLVGTQTLCGSIASMDECVRLFRRATGCPVEYVLEAAALHPARALGAATAARKGSLAFGADADFVLLDDELRVRSTWIGGELVYEARQ